MPKSDSDSHSAVRHFDEIIEATPDAAIVIDALGLIQFVNAQTEQLFGYARDELIGRPIEVLLPERFRDRHVQMRNAYMADPQTRPMGRGLELFGLSKTGAEIPVDIALSPLADPAGPLALCALRDISYLKDAELQIKRQAQELAAANEQLEKRNKELNDLAGVLAHDLRAPLRHLTEFSKLLIEDTGDALSDDSREYLGYMTSAAANMQALISDLLEYARAGNSEINKQTVSLKQCVDEVLLFLRSSIEATHAEIIVDELPDVQADPRLLQQVFQNLIANALKFVDAAAPVIKITVEERETDRVIGVKDNGIGIDRKYAEQIFAPFKRAATNAHYEGTGIGLATCEKVVTRHGGRIWVESEPGKGAHFKFTLPRGS